MTVGEVGFQNSDIGNDAHDYLDSRKQKRIGEKSQNEKFREESVVPKLKTTCRSPRNSPDGTEMAEIFVRNINRGITTEKLRALFERFGEVVKIEISGSVGFVQMMRQEEAIASIKALQGYVLNGSRLCFQFSTRTAQRAKRTRIEMQAPGGSRCGASQLGMVRCYGMGHTDPDVGRNSDRYIEDPTFLRFRNSSSHLLRKSRIDAYVEPDSYVGFGSYAGPDSYVGSGAYVGPDAYVGPELPDAYVGPDVHMLNPMHMLDLMHMLNLIHMLDLMHMLDPIHMT